jgi:DNA-binding response OmpR family regulator
MRCRWMRQAARALQAFLVLEAPPIQPPQTISIGSVTLDLRARRALVDGFTVHLPAREAALLMSLMGNAGRVLTIDELARAAGLDRTDQARTRRYMERLRRRLIVHPIGPVLVERVGKGQYRFSLIGTALRD